MNDTTMYYVYCIKSGFEKKISSDSQTTIILYHIQYEIFSSSEQKVESKGNWSEELEKILPAILRSKDNWSNGAWWR